MISKYAEKIAVYVFSNINKSVVRDMGIWWNICDTIIVVVLIIPFGIKAMITEDQDEIFLLLLVSCIILFAPLMLVLGIIMRFQTIYFERDKEHMTLLSCIRAQSIAVALTLEGNDRVRITAEPLFGSEKCLTPSSNTV